VFYAPEEVAAGQPAAHLATALRDGHLGYEGWRRRKDGGLFWADVVLTPVLDETGALRGFGEVTRDSTKRHQSEQAMRDSEEQFRVLVAGVRDYAIVMVDPDGQVASWNAGAEQITGYQAVEVLGQPYSLLFPPDEVADGLPAHHLAETVRLGHVEYEGTGVRRDGTTFWGTVVLTAVVDDTGRLRGIRAVMRDVSERRQLEAQLAHQALHDPLTGLANRTLLVERLEQAIARLPRHPGLLAVLFLDLDRFKLINDAMGHDAGDDLLLQSAGLLRAAVRPHDMIARFGGDEFVVVCEDIADADDLERIAVRVTRALHVPVQLQDREVLLSASVGVVTATGDRTAVQLLRDADAAMYQAKEQGRGRYALFDESTRASLSDRLRLGSELHRAIERGELRAAYQPLVDLRTGQLEAVEALVRWQHPARGLLGPGAFLGTAEELGTVVDFDVWMAATACRDAVEQGRRLGRPLGAWVNLSGRTLADPGLPQAIASALDRSGLDPALLTLEITEGALMRDAATTVTTLTTLRALGVCLAVDDFGTGYSSLAYLQKFPVHALKVDQSFVQRLDVAEEAASSAAILRAVVGLSDSLELRTVAEGIETPAQLAAVTALGCALGQGYLLGRPGPATDLVGEVVEDVLPRSSA